MKNNTLFFLLKSKYWLFGLSFFLTFSISVFSLYPSYSFMVIYDELLPQKNYDKIIFQVFCLIIMYLFMSLLSILNSSIVLYINNKIENELRLFLVEHIFKQSYKKVESLGHGQLLTRFQSDIVSVSMWVSVITSTIASNVASFFTVTGFIYLLNKKLLLCILIFFPIYVAINLIFKKTIYKQQIKVQNSYSGIVNYLEDFLNGLRDIALSVNKKFYINKLQGAQDVNLKNSIKMDIINNCSNSMSNLVALIGPLVTFAYGCSMVIENEITIGVLISFMTVSSRLFSSLSVLSNLKLQQYSINVSCDRLNDLITNKYKNEKEAQKNENIYNMEAKSIYCEINGKEILRDISFELKKGMTCIIDGPNGAGKSTLLEIIAGIQKPTSGQILINNKSIEEYPDDFVRRKIALVPQTAHIFNFSLLDNLVCLSGNYSEMDLKKYLDVAEINKEISRLNWNDLESTLGNSNRMPSGGEVNRIALIRALLLNSDILILDETFAPLPINSEHEILKRIRTIQPNLIIIIVSHRNVAFEGKSYFDLQLMLDCHGNLTM